MYTPPVLLHRERQCLRRRAGGRVLHADQGYPYALELRGERAVEREEIIRPRDALTLAGLLQDTELGRAQRYQVSLELCVPNLRKK